MARFGDEGVHAHVAGNLHHGVGMVGVGVVADAKAAIVVTEFLRNFFCGRLIHPMGLV